MKKSLLKTFGAASLALIAVVLSIQIYVSGQESDRSFRSGLEGVWETVITPRNCQTGAPVAPPFRGLLTFHSDGTLAEANTSPGGQAARTAGHGVWKRERGWQEYSFAFMFYRFNPDGSLAGSQKIRQLVTLGERGDEFTTTGTVEILDANGNTLVNGCTTSTGTRFE